MYAKKGDIIRLRFNDVNKPSPERGLVEIEVDSEGLSSKNIEKFEKHLTKWIRKVFDFQDRDYSSFRVPEECLGRDLIKHYSNN